MKLWRRLSLDLSKVNKSTVFKNFIQTKLYLSPYGPVSRKTGAMKTRVYRVRPEDIGKYILWLMTPDLDLDWSEVEHQCEKTTSTRKF